MSSELCKTTPSETSSALLFKVIVSVFGFKATALLRALPARRELQESSGLPEAIPDPAAGRIPGLWAGHAVSHCSDGSAALVSTHIQAQAHQEIQGCGSSCNSCVKVRRKWSVSSFWALWMDTINFKLFSVCRMRFLTRKWQRAVRRVTLSGTINGHLTG